MTVYFAKRFPEAQIYGVDFAPVSIPEEHMPPNVTFIQGNILHLIDTDPRLERGSVDFLFSRLLAAGMQNWKEYISCVVSLLRSGGITEMQDFGSFELRNESGKSEYEGSKWLEFARKNIGKKMGLDFSFWEADGVMKECGLVDTEMELVRLNWGSAKDESESKWVEEGRKQWYAAFLMFMERIVEGEENGVRDEVMRDAKERVAPPREGVWFPFTVAWGRKP